MAFFKRRSTEPIEAWRVNFEEIPPEWVLLVRPHPNNVEDEDFLQVITEDRQSYILREGEYLFRTPTPECAFMSEEEFNKEYEEISITQKPT